MYIYFRKDSGEFSHTSNVPDGGEWLLEFQNDTARPGFKYTLDGNEIIEGEALPPVREQDFDIAAFNLQALRRLRDTKLAETDWMATVDSPVFSPTVAAYRQALRDITKEYVSVADVIWPTLPTKT